MTKVALLDDWQKIARRLADFGPLDARAEVTVFHDHVTDPAALVERLMPFDVVCVMRERTPLPREILAALPRLRLLVTTGRQNAAVDTAYAAERGIPVLATGSSPRPPIELTWALLLGLARHVAVEATAVRAGGWQQTVGVELAGKRLGVVGLGKIGGEVARIGKAFGMEVVAWSPNLTAERAAEIGAARVTKDELFATADFVTLHLVLGPRSRGVVGAAELGRMKPTARLVNTARGALVDEAALVAALAEGRLAGAALDVFEEEPLPAEHPFRVLPNVLATPHLGYVTEDLYLTFYRETVAQVVGWLDAVGR